MKKLNKHILEAINRGIRLALDDYEEQEVNEPIVPKKDIIKNSNTTKELIDLYNQFVDLGLPSGTLWAKFNLGCNFDKLNLDPKHTKPEDWYGNYYAWGEINPNKKEYNGLNYKFSELYLKYNEDDKLTELIHEDDAAYQSDNRMKMPTKEQFEELLKYTTQKCVTNYKGVKGLNGRVYTSIMNYNNIFIPCSGYNTVSPKDVGINAFLWTSTLFVNNDNSECAYYYFLAKSKVGGDAIGKGGRHVGRVIRPVLNR